MLVEQNAAMALAVADDAVVLEVGRVSLSRAAPTSWPRARRSVTAISASVRDAAPTAPAGVRAPQPDSVGELEVEGLTVRFGGIAALERRLVHASPPARCTR